jgi:hypothetical protein
VCSAFLAAMTVYGIPEEVLTDNGKQFTGRFGKHRPAEVLFERLCRKNGITQRLTRPRSPTTTGKIERLHQSLQDELLHVHAPFKTIAEAQAVVDAWRQDYNTKRPHQSLDMASPASREADDALSLWAPADLKPITGAPSAAEDAAADPEPASWPDAVEVDRVVLRHAGARPAGPPPARYWPVEA